MGEAAARRMKRAEENDVYKHNGHFSKRNWDKLFIFVIIKPLEQQREIAMNSLLGRFHQKSRTAHRYSRAGGKFPGVVAVREQLPGLREVEFMEVHKQYKKQDRKRTWQLAEMDLEKHPALSLKREKLQRSAIRWYCCNLCSCFKQNIRWQKVRLKVPYKKDADIDLYGKVEVTLCCTKWNRSVKLADEMRRGLRPTKNTIMISERKKRVHVPM